MEITDEMRIYSQNRTRKHIQRVILLGEILGYNFEDHDDTKFSEELNDAYVLIDNSYRKDLEPPVPYTEEMAEASWKHIKQERHHPEYWDDTAIMRSKDVGRDKPDVGKIVDATKMDTPAMAEMVCDWVAMSMELGSSPKEWADKNIGVRWTFTEEQKVFIYFIIGQLWPIISDICERQIQEEHNG